ncbi:MAG: transglutaminase-like domain-containing protein [Bacteroidales bacterium]|nr:transglutaminase-like domain-containing protein [Bacteroidales bacterium]
MKIDAELLSIISLMDDPDITVREAVINRLVSRGEESLQILDRYITENRTHDYERQKEVLNHARDRIAFERLSRFLNSRDHTLLDGMILVSKCLNPEINEQLFSSQISEMSEEIIQELSDDKTDLENMSIFNYFFFRRLGFVYSDFLIEKEEGTLLDQVLITRKGNPVAISIMYFLLARAVGMEIYPLCFPGGFVPVLKGEKGKILFYLNIFKGGAVFTKENLADFFKEIGVEYTPDDVRVEDDLALVVIYAELLGYLYRNDENSCNYKRIERVLSLMGDKRFL